MAFRANTHLSVLFTCKRKHDIFWNLVHHTWHANILPPPIASTLLPTAEARCGSASVPYIRNSSRERTILNSGVSIPISSEGVSLDQFRIALALLFMHLYQIQAWSVVRLLRLGVVLLLLNPCNLLSCVSSRLRQPQFDRDIFEEPMWRDFVAPWKTSGDKTNRGV